MELRSPLNKFKLRQAWDDFFPNAHPGCWCTNTVTVNCWSDLVEIKESAVFHYQLLQSQVTAGNDKLDAEQINMVCSVTLEYSTGVVSTGRTIVLRTPLRVFYPSTHVIYNGFIKKIWNRGSGSWLGNTLRHPRKILVFILSHRHIRFLLTPFSKWLLSKKRKSLIAPATR